MMTNRLPTRRLALAIMLAVPASALPAAARVAPGRVDPAWVKAHEEFLAGDALQGRGSATRDEAIAAAYVGAQFAGYGLTPAPGAAGFVDTARIVRLSLATPATLAVAGRAVAGLSLIVGPTADLAGTLTVAATADPATLPAGDMVLVTAPVGERIRDVVRAAAAGGVKLLIVRESDRSRAMLAGMGGRPRMPVWLEAGPAPVAPAVTTLPDAAVDRLARQAGAAVTLTMPGLVREIAITSNAVGYLPGTDPAAGVLLLSAHLDHLGRQPDGTVLHGANDDASGVTAVLELARTLAGGRGLKRGILFVCYGSEESGGYGSRHFADHPPVPLDRIVANIEVEMIGAQDPKLPAGVMMMTGYDRSTLGPALRAQGALVTADPYPEQNFFERSDNYQLALSGVVAHTISGWAVTPTYHQPTDTVAALDIPFMTRAIQSLVAPIRWLADGRFRPGWTGAGRPTR